VTKRANELLKTQSDPKGAEHHTREGAVYCAVVLDAFYRRVVGWSIDSSQTSNLVVNALGMAVENRRAEGAVIHGDHGTEGRIGWSS
jgi:putative transposase